MFNKLLVVLPLTLSLAFAADEFLSERLLGIEVYIDIQQQRSLLSLALTTYIRREDEKYF